MLEKVRVGQRSGVSPVLGSVTSQNHWNVRVCTVSRNGSFGLGPVTGLLVAQPANATSEKKVAATRIRRGAATPVLQLHVLNVTPSYFVGFAP
jgi:hypothetical protein